MEIPASHLPVLLTQPGHFLGPKLHHGSLLKIKANLNV